MPKKTRKHKLRADKHRSTLKSTDNVSVPADQKPDSQAPIKNTYIFQSATSHQEKFTSASIKNTEDFTLVRKDLVKTTIIALIILALEIGLIYNLSRLN